jgi:lysozyme
MTAAELACAMARHFEALRLRPYLDAVGVPTIGYGATYYANGVRVSLHDEPMTKDAAEDLLRWMITTKYMPKVQVLCPGIDTDQRLAAITDFAFNCGVVNLKNSTLRRKINAGRWSEVSGQLARWNKAGGIILPGLTTRRAYEAGLCR